MTSVALAEISPKVPSFFSSCLVMEEVVQPHWGPLAAAPDLRDAVGAIDPAALAVTQEDAAIFFLPMMLKEFFGAVAMAR
jgi:hypothetical protein